MSQLEKTQSRSLFILLKLIYKIKMPFDLLASRNYINEISIYENAKVILWFHYYIYNNKHEFMQEIKSMIVKAI